MDIQLEHLQDKNRFIAKVDDHVATLKYKIVDDNVLNYYSTFVPEELRGAKVGYELVKFGLEYAKRHNFKIMPECWFVKKVMDREEEYQSMIASTL